jgi:IS30 family transposase
MARHLTAEEREVIAKMLHARSTQAEIARHLGRDPSTIYRERRRNGLGGTYVAVKAQAFAVRRHREARARSRKLNRPELREYVYAKLKLYWSPEQVAGRLGVEFPFDKLMRISRQTIYSHLRSCPFRKKQFAPYLRGGKRRTRHPPQVPREWSIASRPKIINDRKRFGDWEGDTMRGPSRSPEALVALVERRSRFLELGRVKNRQSRVVMAAIRKRLEPYPEDLLLSCTFDNGAEFADHLDLRAQLGLETYFARPHCPWQRGTNEYTIRLVRQFLPKGTDLRDVPPSEVQRIATLLNERPRKGLGFQTPTEVFTTQCYRAFQT